MSGVEIMSAYVFGQDEVELSGSSISVLPSTDASRPNDWTLALDLDAGQDAFLKNRKGTINPNSRIKATVSVSRAIPFLPEASASKGALLVKQRGRGTQR